MPRTMQTSVLQVQYYKFVVLNKFARMDLNNCNFHSITYLCHKPTLLSTPSRESCCLACRKSGPKGRSARSIACVEDLPVCAGRLIAWAASVAFTVITLIDLAWSWARWLNRIWDRWSAYVLERVSKHVDSRGPLEGVARAHADSEG